MRYTTAVNTGLGSQGRGRRQHWGLLPGHSQTTSALFCVLEFFDSKAMSRAEKNGDTDIRRSKESSLVSHQSVRKRAISLGPNLGVVFIPFIWSLQTRCKFRASGLTWLAVVTGWLKWWTSHTLLPLFRSVS